MLSEIRSVGRAWDDELAGIGAAEAALGLEFWLRRPSTGIIRWPELRVWASISRPKLQRIASARVWSKDHLRVISN
jgi:hypothetical protein